MTSTLIPPDLYYPEFDPGWLRHSLYDLATWINGMAFKDINFANLGTPVIKIAEIRNGVSGQTRFTQEKYDPKYFLQDGDMLFCWSGQPETSIDTYWWRGGEGWLNQHIFKVLPNQGLVDRSFFYQLLRYLRPTFVQIARNKQTTGLGHVTKTDLQRLVVAIPPLQVQRGIAATLGALDDKIESNRRLSQIMWDLLAAEYEQLSADSEPVEIRQLLSLEYGKSLPAVKRVSGNVPVYGSNGITGSHDKELIPGPGVIVGRKGSIGEVHWSHVASFPIDTTFYVSPISGYPLLACYFALKNAELRDKNSDSAIPGLNREAALGARILAPTAKVAQNWSASRQEILCYVHHLDSENAELTSLRDTLLPELLSGRIRVPEAREAVQEAVI